MVGSIYTSDTQDRNVSQPGQDRVRFHDTTQSGVQFKMYELFISGISHLIFLDLCWTHTTDIIENGAKGSGYYSTYPFG